VCNTNEHHGSQATQCERQSSVLGMMRRSDRRTGPGGGAGKGPGGPVCLAPMGPVRTLEAPAEEPELEAGPALAVVASGFPVSSGSHSSANSSSTFEIHMYQRPLRPPPLQPMSTSTTHSTTSTTTATTSPTSTTTATTSTTTAATDEHITTSELPSTGQLNTIERQSAEHLTTFELQPTVPT
jgi:Tfp pilus assembly major pilin PilA